MTDIFTVEYIIPRRGGHRRGGVRNGLCFMVKWLGYDECTLEPVENFIDISTGEVQVDVFNFISKYEETAKKYPNLHRKCVCCCQRVTDGAIFCNSTYCRKAKQLIGIEPKLYITTWKYVVVYFIVSFLFTILNMKLSYYFRTNEISTQRN